MKSLLRKKIFFWCKSVVRLSYAFKSIITFIQSTAKIYHDIGLVYSAEKCHQSASECFEHAYHSLQGLSDKEQDKSLLAIVLQNLGAIYNQMEVYERAGSFHKMAADLYGE